MITATYFNYNHQVVAQQEIEHVPRKDDVVKLGEWYYDVYTVIWIDDGSTVEIHMSYKRATERSPYR